MREIFIYDTGSECPIIEFFKCTNAKVRNKLKYQLEYIKDERNPLCAPHVKHFSIEKYRQMYELRIKASGTMVRVIFHMHNDEITFLHAFVKRDRKDTERALETALRILQSILQDNGEVKNWANICLRESLSSLLCQRDTSHQAVTLLYCAE